MLTRCPRYLVGQAVFSTLAFETVKLAIDLPHLGDSRPPSGFVTVKTLKVTPVFLTRMEISMYFSGRLQTHVYWFDMPPAGQYSSSERVNRYCLHDVLQPQQVMAARIFQDHLVLAGSHGLEVYSIGEISTLTERRQQGASPEIINPTQRIEYPQGKSFDHISFLAPLSFTPQRAQSDFNLGMLSHGFWYRLHVQLSTSSDSAPSISLNVVFYAGELKVLAVCWGGSGRRLLFTSGWKQEIWVVGIPKVLDLRASHDKSSEVEWIVNPEGENDLFAGLAFDESSGLCVVAMRSGRVWIDDWSKSPSAHTTSVSYQREQETRIPLHPDPSWPTLHPVPRPANVRPDQVLLVNNQSAISWSTEIEHYFPLINDPECYGGVRWFLNEVLHIPGSATLVMFTTPSPSTGSSPSVKIVQLDSGRFVGVEWDGWLCFVRLFEPHLNLNNLLEALGEHGQILIQMLYVTETGSSSKHFSCRCTVL
ncbi:hypothetical protein FRB90_008333 [Tulasnella sp. 427]|nr:hypothetical protein FRB90_008333 [Tulasnella sp. 427]